MEKTIDIYFICKEGELNMKLITKNPQLARALAIILSVVMLITTLNLSTILSVFALPENTSFTVIVKDVSGVPVEGATVTVTPVDGEINIENLQPVATNADGKASFEAITEFFSSNLDFSMSFFNHLCNTMFSNNIRSN